MRIPKIYLETKEGVIPEKYKYDGLHIAIATINELEYIDGG